MPFFSPFLGIYSVYHPSATHVFPQLMAAIVERIKDTFWCIRLSGASRCRDFFNPLTYLDYPLLLEIDIDAHATKSIFPSGNGVSMQVGCNGTNWDKFHGISEFQQQHGLLNATFVRRVTFEARIVSRDVKNESRIN